MAACSLMAEVPVEPAAAVETAPQTFLATIVVAPIEGWDRWIEAIRHTADQHGLTVHIVMNHADLAGGDAPATTILVTHDATLVEPFRADHRVTVIADTRNALAWSAANGHALAPTLSSISRTLALAALTPSRAQRVVEADLRHGPVGLWPGFSVELQSDPHAPAMQDLSEAECAAVEALAVLAGAPERSLQTRWGEPLFAYDQKFLDRPHLPTIETSGRARAMVWGPYVYLPGGLWRVTARFSVEGGAERHQYRAEWGTPEPTLYATHEFRPGREGIFDIVIDYKWIDTAPAEFRLIMTEGSLGGTFTFMGLQLERAE